MSAHNIRRFFDFKRVKIKEFGTSKDAKITQVKLEPDIRFLPICSGCKKKSTVFILMSIEPFGI
jgi:hypothetical protein